MLSCYIASNSLRPHGLQPTRLLCGEGFSRKKYWSGLPVPLQGIFSTWGLTHISCIGKRILLPLSHLGNPYVSTCYISSLLIQSSGNYLIITLSWRVLQEITLLRVKMFCGSLPEVYFYDHGEHLSTPTLKLFQTKILVAMLQGPWSPICSCAGINQKLFLGIILAYSSVLVQSITLWSWNGLLQNSARKNTLSKRQSIIIRLGEIRAKEKTRELSLVQKTPVLKGMWVCI